MQGEEVRCPQCRATFRAPGTTRDSGYATGETVKPTKPVLEAVAIADEKDVEARRPYRRRYDSPCRVSEGCPFCGCTQPAIPKNEISQGGWILFAVLAVVFLPLCWIGLLMSDTYYACYDCGARLPAHYR